MDTQETVGWVPNAASFGARLALIRQHEGWGNVAEAARACAISVETWRNWEASNATPRDAVAVAKQIAGATGCDYFWLLTGEIRQTTASAA